MDAEEIVCAMPMHLAGATIADLPFHEFFYTTTTTTTTTATTNTDTDLTGSGDVDTGSGISEIFTTGFSDETWTAGWQTAEWSTQSAPDTTEEAEGVSDAGMTVVEVSSAVPPTLQYTSDQDGSRVEGTSSTESVSVSVRSTTVTSSGVVTTGQSSRDDGGSTSTSTGQQGCWFAFTHISCPLIALN